MPEQALKILSIDGGGMRGIYASAYLCKLQDINILGKDPNQHLDVGKAFDLIVGTSSGAIIACGLAAGVPVTKIANAFARIGPRVFPRPIPVTLGGLFLDYFRRKKSIKSGEMALMEELEIFLGDTTIGDVWIDRKIALAIPAVHLANHRAWVFKTPHLPGSNNRDADYRLVDVCLASSAAPIYRSIANIKPSQSHGSNTEYKAFVDGGLYANNPVMAALWDALEMNTDKQPIEIYCLGTNPPQGGSEITDNDNNWGYLEWKAGSKAVDITLDAQHLLFDYMARTIAKHLKVQCSIIRLPSEPLPPDLSRHCKLDATSAASRKALITQAEADVDTLNRRMNQPSDNEAQKIKALFRNMEVVSYPQSMTA